jgi:hypothetical protein
MGSLPVRTLIILAATAALSLAVAAVVNAAAGWAIFACATLVVLVHHLRRLGQLHRWLHAATLRRVWPTLWLPPALRSAWESRFPDLRPPRALAG